MLPLGLIILLYVCLLAGVLTFLLAFALPRLSRFALSAAAWWAALGGCLTALILFAGLVAFAGAEAWDRLGVRRLPAVHPPWGILMGTSFWGAVAFAAVCATTVACVHQFAIRRMTLSLFRLYCSLVCAGMGTVLAWLVLIPLSNWNASWLLAVAALGVALLVAGSGFGVAGYHLAARLRDPAAPVRWTWITPEEYAGSR